MSYSQRDNGTLVVLSRCFGDDVDLPILATLPSEKRPLVHLVRFFLIGSDSRLHKGGE